MMAGENCRPCRNDERGRIALYRRPDVGGDIKGVNLKLVIRFNYRVRELQVASRQIPLKNIVDERREQ